MIISHFYTKQVHSDVLLIGISVDGFYMIAPEEKDYEELAKLQKIQTASECLDEFREKIICL